MGEGRGSNGIRRMEKRMRDRRGIEGGRGVWREGEESKEVGEGDGSVTN